MQKLPIVLEDEIRWLAQEPTPSAKCMHELTFCRCIARGRIRTLVIDYPDSRRVFRKLILRVPPPIYTNMTEYLQNQLEQDRIAKAIEPVVAENLMQKLPTVLKDKIRWWATEPTPTAKIMKDVSILFRVFPHSDYSPFGPGKKCVIHAELWKRGAFFWDPNLPDFVRRCEKTFKIHDIPLDAEPTNTWRYYP